MYSKIKSKIIVSNGDNKNAIKDHIQKLRLNFAEAKKPTPIHIKPNNIHIILLPFLVEL
jgi:predicted HAD superfamily phosphohydrolase YqeG